jgi:ADP-ribose pyrophosphatase
MPELKKKEAIYKGRVIRLYLEDWLEEGKEQTREVIEHPGASAVLPVERDTVYLVNQFRHATRGYFLEIPAGLIDDGETPEETARREVREEIGAEVINLRKIAEVYSSPGFTNEVLHLYIAEVRKGSGEPELDSDEHLEVVPVSVREFLRMIERNEIKDSKTLIAGLTLLSDLKKRIR